LRDLRRIGEVAESQGSLGSLRSASVCYISATVAKALAERRTERFHRHSTVDALDHPRVAVAHRYTDEVRLDAAQPEPGSVGAAEVVR